MSENNPALRFSPQVEIARMEGDPIVALESTVITHGLPYPENLQLAHDMERIVRENGAVPATVAVISGNLHIGLVPSNIESLARSKSVRKLSRRDLAGAIAAGESGGTTVAATLFAAHQAGIRVFATGGIGGVHRGAPFDISADLHALSETPMIVVCAGAKAILDLPATLETLETLSVPVVGYRTLEFPAFYSKDSGLGLSRMASTPEDVANLAAVHWSLGLNSAVLVTVPPPEHAAIPFQEVEKMISSAVEEAQRNGLRGQGVTPFLLARLSQLSAGTTLQSNLALLEQNAQLAARIAVSLSRN